MNFYYDPLDEACKSSVGAFAREVPVTFRIYRKNGGEANFSADVCYFVLYRDGGEPELFPMKREGEVYSVTLKFHETGLYFYHFTFGEGVHLGCGTLRRGVLTDSPVSWQITVFSEDYRTPDWFKGGVMYQIFPDRFAKEGTLPAKPYQILRDDWGGQPTFRPNEFGKVLNNDFFGGNLNGIRKKLGYLEALGVTAIYLNPIFEAYSNHRYDTGDYMRIDGLLGTNEDFTALSKDAAAHGMKIILDGVFNHTGDDSRYFNKFGRYDSLGAYQSTSSPYSSWYRFRRFPDSYESWWGIETLPAVNEASESYQEFICGQNGVVKTWLRRGASGYRLDVADELPDFFLKKVRQAIKETDPDALVIGEVWEDASNKIAYSERRTYLQGEELDSVMNYPLKDAIIGFVKSGRTLQLRETVAMLLDNYPKETLDCLMNILGTHDTPRILTVFGGKECSDKETMALTFLSEPEKQLAKEKVRMAALLQYTLPGVPCIYYGDEIGMQGYLDPFCRGCFPWDDMDEALLAFYRKLGEIRTKRYPEIFQGGAYREVFADSACLVFERRKGERRLYIYCNNSASEYRMKFDGTARELLSGKREKGVLEIRAHAYGIVEVE